MEGFEEKLNAILNDRDSMEQIMSLAKSLGVGPPPDGAGTDQEHSAGSSPLDENMLRTLMAVMQDGGRINEQQLALLNALRPFLSPSRRNSVDRAVRIARLTGIAEAALKNGNFRF